MAHKAVDKKNRWRNKTVGFRVSPEEWDQIETYVRLSGIPKQDYIMSKLLDKEVTITPNPRVFKALRNELVSVSEQLERIDKLDKSDDLYEMIDHIASLLDGLKEDLFENRNKKSN